MTLETARRLNRHLPRTASRVAEHSPGEANRRIWRAIEDSVHYYARHPHLIGERLRELDEEWDIERALGANAATLSLLGLALGSTWSPRFRLLSAAVAVFLLQHALHGWCPPVALLRRLGVRTASEIDAERQALRALRGDWRGVYRQPGADRDAQARAALAAARE
ncbi:MAG TPA: YgaP-like transmembrane domain [Azospirillaceae bacterium]|nr:YgaP-like transmembrane domain [Azospirillaceae bacterium]